MSSLATTAPHATLKLADIQQMVRSLLPECRGLLERVAALEGTDAARVLTEGLEALVSSRHPLSCSLTRSSP